MIYHVKLYAGSPDGGITDLAGEALVFAGSEPEAIEKAQEHWEGFIKSEGGAIAMQATVLRVEVIIP